MTVWRVAGILLVILAVSVVLYTSYQTVKPTNHSATYDIVLAEIEKGNDYVIKVDRSDVCFPYRYFDRGCYYEAGHDFEIYFMVGDLRGYKSEKLDLAHEEKWDLCYKFAHKGAVAYCLSQNAIDENERQKCLDFANNNTYLTRICSLTANETIPTFGDNSIPYIRYSDLLHA